MRRVLIVGGGTGGTMLANKLARRCEVTLLAASADHMFRPALLYVAFAHGSTNIVRKERSLLSRRVRLVEDRVTRVDLRARKVETQSGARFDYDTIVLAPGAGMDVNEIAGLPEVNARFGDYHSSIAQAQKVWAELDAFTGGTIALGQASPIIVCPPSPVEGILLADRLLRKKGLRDKSRLVFFTPFPRPYPAEPMSEIIEPIMQARGIEIMTFFDVDRIDPATRTITSIEGDSITYDLPIIIPPFVGARIAFEPESVLNPEGFIITDKETLQVNGFDTAYAIGDGTNVPTSKAGVGAHLEADVVARRLSGHAAVFDGRTHCPVDLGDGTGTFVIGSYAAPVEKVRPRTVYHWMKTMFGWSYWWTLSGLLDPMLDIYFWLTKPRARAAMKGAKTQQV
jgi:sulfide:quinone oxidoreductase